MAKYRTEILIVGGGAAGLACARELSQARRDFIVVEGRGRLGGRILSRVLGGDQPVELGAEFVHGAPPLTLSLLDRYGLPFVDVVDEHLYLEGGRKTELPDFFARIEKMMPSSSRAGDVSLADFLGEKKAWPKWKGQFRAFVEGFHAADLNLMGTKALALTEEADDAELNGSAMFRIIPGYSRLVEGLASDLDRKKIFLKTKVDEIQWERGAVKALCRAQDKEFNVYARRVVITIPIGTLKSASRPLLNPQIPRVEQALAAMEMGHVQRFVFSFHERFWERLAPDKRISFMHGDPKRHFPVWWTQAPIRSHHLVAWQGGPRAAAMSAWPRDEIADEALSTLAHMTNISKRGLRDNLKALHTHNWSRDPFSMGAYSYIRKEGVQAARLLARPTARTVWFAGEGACFDASKGTVHGALASGRAAAREVLLP